MMVKKPLYKYGKDIYKNIWWTNCRKKKASKGITRQYVYHGACLWKYGVVLMKVYAIYKKKRDRRMNHLLGAKHEQ